VKVEEKTEEVSLKDMTLPEAYVYVARILGVPAKELLNKYNHLNNGMIRMNLGNRLRGHLARNK
jgi:colicin import membrane protein